VTTATEVQLRYFFKVIFRGHVAIQGQSRTGESRSIVSLPQVSKGRIRREPSDRHVPEIKSHFSNVGQNSGQNSGLEITRDPM
jgi:hypothetical protein